MNSSRSNSPITVSSNSELNSDNSVNSESSSLSSSEKKVPSVQPIYYKIWDTLELPFADNETREMKKIIEGFAEIGNPQSLAEAIVRFSLLYRSPFSSPVANTTNRRTRPVAGSSVMQLQHAEPAADNKANNVDPNANPVPDAEVKVVPVEVEEQKLVVRPDTDTLIIEVGAGADIAPGAQDDALKAGSKKDTQLQHMMQPNVNPVQANANPDRSLSEDLKNLKLQIETHAFNLGGRALDGKKIIFNSSTKRVPTGLAEIYALLIREEKITAAIASNQNIEKALPYPSEQTRKNQLAESIRKIAAARTGKPGFFSMNRRSLETQQIYAELAKIGLDGYEGCSMMSGSMPAAPAPTAP